MINVNIKSCNQNSAYLLVTLRRENHSFYKSNDRSEPENVLVPAKLFPGKREIEFFVPYKAMSPID